jgi:hypothetical protein
LQIAGEVSSRQADGTRAPTLLLLAGQAEYTPAVCELWRRALESYVVRESSLKILRDWLLLADQAPALQSATEPFIRGVYAGGTSGEQQRLRYYLGLWATDMSKPSALAGRIVSSL